MDYGGFENIMRLLGALAWSHGKVTMKRRPNAGTANVGTGRG